MSARRASHALPCLLVATMAGSATAAGHRVTIAGAAHAVEEAKLARLVDLELADARDIEHVTIELSDDRAVVVTTRGKTTRSAAVDIPRAGDVERTLALLVGELATAPEPAAEASPPPPPTSASTVPTAAEMPPGEPTPARARASVIGGVGVRAFTIGGATMLGPSLAAAIGVGERVAVGLGGRYLVGTERDVLGDVSAQWLCAGVYVDYVPARGRTTSLHLGAGLDGSWTRGSGSGRGEAVATALGVSPNAFIELRRSLASRVRVVVAADGGYLGSGLDLRADGRSALNASGLFVGGRFGLAVDL